MKLIVHNKKMPFQTLKLLCWENLTGDKDIKNIKLTIKMLHMIYAMDSKYWDFSEKIK